MARDLSPRHGLIIGLFAFTGCASLMDQVVWLRYLSLSFGNTTYAAATLLAVFMGGLGLGALLFGRLADRLPRPLAAFAGVQVGVALIAMASPLLFRWIDLGYVWIYRSLGDAPLLFAFGRMVLAALFLLPPTMLMGGTLPLILRAVRGDRAVGRLTALVYAVNTLGAVVGVGLAGFVTIRLFGLYATLLLAALLDLAAGLGCLLLSRTEPPAGAESEDAESEDAGSEVEATPVPASGEVVPEIPARAWLLALFFAMGATSLALEVLWTRILVFYLGSSVYAYSLMLLLFLLGVGLGSLVLAPWADRLRRPLLVLAGLEAALGVWALLQVGLFQSLNGLLAAIAGATALSGFSGVVIIQLLALVPILVPPTVLMGMSFPLAVRALYRSDHRLGTDVGQVYGANTVGSVVGSLGAGFVAIPLLGTQNSLVVVGVLNAALAAILVATRPAVPALWRWASVTLPLALLASLMVLAPDRVILSAGLFAADRPGDLLYFHEDASASVTIRRQHTESSSYLLLELNGVNVAGTSPNLYAVQKMQGHLPLLLADDPREVVHIGFGSGGTAHAVSRHPVDSILIVEISPAVLAASDHYFGDINHGVLHDPRVSVEINDGRNFLLASPRLFDAVLSDSIHPRYSGNGSLYTVEYFRLLRQRLRPGGVASMWLPTYSLTPSNFRMVVKAFSEVFPNTTVWYEPSALNSFTIVTGRLDDEPWNAEQLRRSFDDPRIAGELADIGIHGPADVLACYLVGGDELRQWLRDTPPHSDDLPAVEYESGALLAKDLTWLATFVELLDLRPETPPERYLAALTPAERERAPAVFRSHTELMRRHRDFLAERLGFSAQGLNELRRQWHEGSAEPAEGGGSEQP